MNRFKIRFPPNSEKATAQAVILHNKKVVLSNGAADLYFTTLLNESKTLEDFKTKIGQILYTVNLFLKPGSPASAATAIAEALANTFESLTGSLAANNLWVSATFDVDEFLLDNDEVIKECFDGKKNIGWKSN